MEVRRNTWVEQVCLKTRHKIIFLIFTSNILICFIHTVVIILLTSDDLLQHREGRKNAKVITENVGIGKYLQFLFNIEQEW